MSTGTTTALSVGKSPKRRVPRYKLTVPLRLSVLRSGIPDSIPGRTLEIGEGGMGVAATSKLLLGESVRVEFLLPHMTAPVRATAVVRYQNDRSFGLQFLRLPVEQQSIIRYWTRCEGEVSLSSQDAPPVEAEDTLGEALAEASAPAGLLEDSENSKPSFRISRVVALAIPIIVIAAAIGWRRWQQEWKDLEAQVPVQETMAGTPQLKVPAEEMQTRIIHQVMPDYPEPAQKAGVQGTVLLNAVISAEGNVLQVKFLSGPETLAATAMDAVRWWRYEPYFVNGQPVTVETTVAVTFRLGS